MSNLKPGSPQQKDVASYTQSAIAHATSLNVLEQQITALSIKVASGTATDVEKAKLKQLQDQQQQLIGHPPDPKVTSVNAPPATNVTTYAAMQNFTITSLAQTPVPQRNNIGEVRYYATTDPKDLVNYINATQFLNPWGRNRQCDDDLKKLMLFINQDFNAELGDWIDVKQRIQEVSSE